MAAWTVLVNMRRLCFLVLIVAFASLTVPARAASGTPQGPPVCVDRPDVAALDQYCPSMPGADGRGLKGPRLADVLPVKLVRRLERAGPLGQALLGLSLAAPETQLASKARGRGLDANDLLKDGTIGGGKSKPSANPIKLAASAVTGGKLDLAFGSVLLMSTFGIAGAAWRRFRRRPKFF
jgi:hypothetical protein